MFFFRSTFTYLWFFCLFFLSYGFVSGWTHIAFSTEQNGKPRAGSSHRTASGAAKDDRQRVTLSWDRGRVTHVVVNMIIVACRFHRLPANSDYSIRVPSRWATAAVIGGSHFFLFNFFLCFYDATQLCRILFPHLLLLLCHILYNLSISRHIRFIIYILWVLSALVSSHRPTARLAHKSIALELEN